jgi:hypothetical protein
LVKGKSLLHQRHIAVSSYQLNLSLERAMSEALTTAAGLLERMAQSTEEHVDDVESAIEQVRDTWHLSDAFGERVKGALLQEPPSQQETLFGLTNAFTQAAQSLAPDERYAIEVLSGKLLEHGIRIIGNKAQAKRKLEPTIASTRAIVDARAPIAERMTNHSGNWPDSLHHSESAQRNGNGTNYGNGVAHGNGLVHNEPLQITRPLSNGSAITTSGSYAPQPVGDGHTLAGIAARRGSVADTLESAPQTIDNSQSTEISQDEGAPLSYGVLRAQGVSQTQKWLPVMT